MRNYLLAFIMGALTSLGSVQAYKTWSAPKPLTYKVGDCIRVLGDASVYQVTYIEGNTVEAETLEAGMFGKMRIAFYNVGENNATVPEGMTRGVLINASCQTNEEGQ